MLRYWPSNCQLGEYRDEGVGTVSFLLVSWVFFVFLPSECDFLDVFLVLFDDIWIIITYLMFDDLRYLKTTLHKSTEELNYDEMEEEHQDFPKSPKSNRSFHPKGTKWPNLLIVSRGTRVRSCCGWSGRHMVMELQNLKKSLAIEAQVPQDDSYQLTPRHVYSVCVLAMKHRCHRCWIWAWTRMIVTRPLCFILFLEISPKTRLNSGTKT